MRINPENCKSPQPPSFSWSDPGGLISNTDSPTTPDGSFRTRRTNWDGQGAVYMHRSQQCAVFSCGTPPKVLRSWNRRSTQLPPAPFTHLRGAVDRVKQCARRRIYTSISRKHITDMRWRGASEVAGGNVERVVDDGRAIGVDRTTGAPTSTYIMRGLPHALSNLSVTRQALEGHEVSVSSRAVRTRRVFSGRFRCRVSRSPASDATRVRRKLERPTCDRPRAVANDQGKNHPYPSGSKFWISSNLYGRIKTDGSGALHQAAANHSNRTG
jgi:hypothetical protein